MKHKLCALVHALDVLRVRHLALDEQGFGFRARDAHDATFEGLRGGGHGQGCALRRRRGGRARGGETRSDGGELLGEHGGGGGGRRRRMPTARAAAAGTSIQRE